MTQSKLDMVVSINRGAPLQIPKYCNPHSGDAHTWTPNLWETPPTFHTAVELGMLSDRSSS